MEIENLETQVDFDEIVHYKVENEISLEIGNILEKESASFLISIKINNKESEITIDRTNFKINDDEISFKYALLSLKYMETVFPITIDFTGDVFKVSNVSEIEKRIKKADETITIEYQGKGFENIRMDFLSKLSTHKKINDFIINLNFIRVIFSSLKKNYLKKMFWNVTSISEIEFFGEIETEGENKYYNACEIDELLFLKKLKKYVKENLINFHFDIESCDFFSGIRYQIEDLKQDFQFFSSQTVVNIAINNNFNYQEKITLNIN